MLKTESYLHHLVNGPLRTDLDIRRGMTLVLGNHYFQMISIPKSALQDET